MDMHNTPEVDAVDAFERSSVIVKMAGNMIEFTRPTDSARHTRTARPCSG